jgi:hypothetical protein
MKFEMPKIFLVPKLTTLEYLAHHLHEPLDDQPLFGHQECTSPILVPEFLRARVALPQMALWS